VLDVEIAGLAQDEGDPIGELLVVVGRDHDNIVCGRECSGGRVGQCGEDGGGADDIEIV
jgi:hypothetical protein